MFGAIFRFLGLCVCLYIRRGLGRVLIKYSGKYVKIYFNMKITCNSCKDWSLAQWEAFHAKRSYTNRKKSNSRHAGGPASLTSESLLSSVPVKQAAPSLAPPPLSAPPSFRGVWDKGGDEK